MYLPGQNGKSSLLHAAMDHALARIGDGPATRLRMPEGEFVARLLDAWYRNETRTAAGRRLLLTHLRRLRPGDGAYLTEAHRERLYFELRRRRNDPYLVAAVLAGLAGLVDPGAVPLARALAAGEVPGTVRQAARDYLERMETVSRPSAPDV